MHVSLIYRGNEETAQKFIDEQEKVIKDSSSNAETNTVKQAQGGM